MILRTTLILRTHIERGINVKKTLLAVSVATVMLPVGAMAAPTFYGKLNLSVDKTSDYPDTALVFSQEDLSDAWFVSSNNSRLGLKGEEPLYNDSLSVIYQMEVAYDADGDKEDFQAETRIWIDPMSSTYFSVELPEMTPGQLENIEFCDRDDVQLKACMMWTITEIMGLTI